MGKEFYIEIGQRTPGNKPAAISFQIPVSVWDRWFNVKFKFKASQNGSYYATHMVVTKDNYIYVKERWYHRLYEKIYLKFRTPKIGFAKDDNT